MKSPFKFLDAYTIEDKDVFFGREKEIDALYESVNKNRLVLIYGQSGAGKTSLVQCGLAGRFDTTDWYPVFVRRQDNINTSLRRALGKSTELKEDFDLKERLHRLNARFLRPVYLIFDQLEELLILGTPEEQNSFVQSLKILLEAEDLSCHLLLIIREEFLGWLYPFEREIPTLFDRRLRVEPMSDSRVKSVLSASFQEFNVELDSPKEDILEKIVENVRTGHNAIQLPYLQVYLDLLWRRVYQKTPAGIVPIQIRGEQIKNNWPKLKIRKNDIIEFGQIEEVLALFIEEQETNLEKELLSRFNEVPEGVVKEILDIFVTEEGTNRPIAISRNGENRLIVLEEKAYEKAQRLSPLMLNECFLQLEQRRLVRITDDHIELAHDSLASLIDRRRTDEQRQIQEVKTRVAAAYREWEKTDHQEYLTRRQLSSLEFLLPKVNLEPHLVKFIENSNRHAEFLEEKEKKRQEVELEKEKHLRTEAELNAKRARQRTRIAVIISVIALGLMILAFLFGRQANFQKKQAVNAKNSADSLTIIAQVMADTANQQRAKAIIQQKRTEDALENQRIAQLESYLAQGRQLATENQYASAIQLFQTAVTLTMNENEKKVVLVETEKCQQSWREYQYSSNREKGLRLAEAGECKAALKYLRAAIKAKPGDKDVINQLEQCKAQ